MRIYLSYSSQDKWIAQNIFQKLVNAGHDVFMDTMSLRVGDNLMNKVNSGLESAEVIIVLFSENSQNSKWVHLELESIVFKEISNEAKRIIPIRLDKALLPSYLLNYNYLNLSKYDLEFGLNRLVEALSEGNKKKNTKKEKHKKENDYKAKNEECIRKLVASLKSGKLTIVCGAGVSIDAKIPSWNTLLVRLLKSMMNNLSSNKNINLKNISLEEFRKRLGPSSLVVGKYLKSNLGNDFLPELRDALYKDNPKTCDLIDAIVEVVRPQREGKPLDSIITFNFDDLIEVNLKKNNINYKAIFNEGIRNKANELPIYHVHGYLPQKVKLTSKNDVVFSEDAYHTQFTDPFSWSNLIQLNKLSQNNCLLVGISLTDPNMRRLLDVAKRKESSKLLNHFIIKKIPNLKSENGSNDELMMFLEEQDANDLGLNVLWVKKFDEIPKIIKRIIE